MQMNPIKGTHHIPTQKEKPGGFSRGKICSDLSCFSWATLAGWALLNLVKSHLRPPPPLLKWGRTRPRHPLLRMHCGGGKEFDKERSSCSFFC